MNQNTVGSILNEIKIRFDSMQIFYDYHFLRSIRPPANSIYPAKNFRRVIIRLPSYVHYFKLPIDVNYYRIILKRKFDGVSLKKLTLYYVQSFPYLN